MSFLCLTNRFGYLPADQSSKNAVISQQVFADQIRLCVVCNAFALMRSNLVTNHSLNLYFVSKRLPLMLGSHHDNIVSSSRTCANPLSNVQTAGF